MPYRDPATGRRVVFLDELPGFDTRKAVSIILISAGGMKKTGHYDIVQRTISGEDLF